MRTEREDFAGHRPAGTRGDARPGVFLRSIALAPTGPELNTSRREAREVYRRACMRAYRFGIAWSASARAVVDHREPLNELNGFPVPDHDTGSNLAHTAHAHRGIRRGMEELFGPR